MSDEEDKGGFSFSIGGFDISGWMLAVAVPVVSSIGGGAWYVFDLQSRFIAVEENITVVLDVESRVQTLEQAAADSDLRGLSSRLSELSTQMNTILENQRQLLDLRQRVDQSTVVTNTLSQDLDRYDTEIEDLWRAVDALDQPLR
jgi:chromosome segregation ATPase